jgi:probable addiction module antidote protein
MNFDCGIYAITSPAGKQYIGQAISFKRRWAQHRYFLRAGIHHCKAMQDDFNAHGEQAFIFSKIAFVSADQLSPREQEQIDARTRDRLYNAKLQVDTAVRSLEEREEARKRQLATRVSRLNASSYAGSTEAIASFLGSSIDGIDPDKFLQALAAVVRAKGMTQIADDTGLGRESLYKALAPGAKPRLETVLKLTRALGIRFVAQPLPTQGVHKEVNHGQDFAI